MPDAFETARPVFETLSDTVRLMGPAGAVQLTKQFNNALTITNMKNAEDVLGLAGKLGLDLVPLGNRIQVVDLQVQARVNLGISWAPGTAHPYRPACLRSPTPPRARR